MAWLRIIYIYFLHGSARSCNLSCLDPFFSYLLIPEERKNHLVWAGIEPRSSCVIWSQATALTTRPCLLGLLLSFLNYSCTYKLKMVLPFGCRRPVGLRPLSSHFRFTPSYAAKKVDSGVWWNEERLLFFNYPVFAQDEEVATEPFWNSPLEIFFSCSDMFLKPRSMRIELVLSQAAQLGRLFSI